MNFHEDDRAQRIMNVFEDVNGQINVSHVNSTEHVVAWHRHEIQTDFWYCAKGSFKVGLAREVGGDVVVEWEYLSDKMPRTLKIEPGVWHGYKALQEGSVMLYYLTEKYDPSDEKKCPPGTFGENWGVVNK